MYCYLNLMPQHTWPGKVGRAAPYDLDLQVSVVAHLLAEPDLTSLYEPAVNVTHFSSPTELPLLPLSLTVATSGGWTTTHVR